MVNVACQQCQQQLVNINRVMNNVSILFNVFHLLIETILYGKIENCQLKTVNGLK